VGYGKDGMDMGMKRNGTEHRSLVICARAVVAPQLINMASSA
jgi:hypothetical protein